MKKVIKSRDVHFKSETPTIADSEPMDKDVIIPFDDESTPPTIEEEALEDDDNIPLL
jgi:hypothetical protein